MATKSSDLDNLKIEKDKVCIDYAQMEIEMGNCRSKMTELQSDKKVLESIIKKITYGCFGGRESI